MKHLNLTQLKSGTNKSCSAAQQGLDELFSLPLLKGPLGLCTEHFLLVAFSNCCHNWMPPFMTVGLQAMVSTFCSSHEAGAALSALYQAMVKATKSSACVTSLVSKGRINPERKVLLLAPDPPPTTPPPGSSYSPSARTLKKKVVFRVTVK